MAKIFVRERGQVGQGAGMPRFAIVAVLGTDLRIFARHIRKAELEKLAEEAAAEIIYLPRGQHAGEENEAEGEQRGGGRRFSLRPGHGQGRGPGAGRRQGGRGAMDQE